MFKNGIHMQICPLCKASNNIRVEEFFDLRDQFNIYRCNECGLSFSDKLDEADSEHYEISEWYGIRWEFNEISKMIKKGMKIFEIGCGRGYFLNLASRKGAITFGIDINKNAISFAREKFGLKNVYSEKLEDFLQNNAERNFDMVCMFHVIEHLKEPREIIKKIRKLLKPSGCICLSFPNPDRIELKLLKREYWDYPPHHLTRWDKKSISYLLNIEGFKVIDVKSEQLSIIKCAESIGTFIQGQFIKNNSKDEKFYKNKRILKPVIMGLLLPAKIKGYSGQAMLVIAIKE